MSLGVRASYAAVVVVGLYLCGAWLPASTYTSDASGYGDTFTVPAYGGLEDRGDTARLSEEADPEDAESVSADRDLQAAACNAGHPASSERSRPELQDRPPRLIRLS